MVGGTRSITRPLGGQRWDLIALAGLLLSTGGPLAAQASDALASDTAYIDDCDVEPSEKSIVVENGRISSPDPEVALASDDLEPIANVSEYEPDLAEQSAARLQEALVPTLADPPVEEQPGVTPVGPGTPEEPTANDVCIDDESEATDFVHTAELHAASFSGVTPGVTTRAEVLATWKTPQENETSGETLTYELAGFPAVAISFKGNIVRSIRIELAKPASAERLIGKLGLAEFRPVETADEAGNPQTTNFPERGVTLHHQAETGAVTATDDETLSMIDPVYEIVVRCIDARPFLVRAERASSGAYSRRIADLEIARQLDAKNTATLVMLSEVKLAMGKAIVAEQLAAQAVALDAQDDACRLQWARCLKELARYEQAVQETRTVLEGTTASPIVRAAALEQMGQLAALGSQEVQRRSAPLHNKAIEVADSLAASEDQSVHAAAHRVLLESHLAMAEQISQGDWAEKDATVEQWITRASALAEQMIEREEADVTVRLQVANSALMAGGRLNPPIDPKPWVAEAEQAVAILAKTSSADRAARDVAQWRLGVTYMHAAEIEHRRGDAEAAIRFGELADSTLTPLADSRSELPDTRYMLGRMYFQIGAVHAVHHQDHELACQWYDRSADLLLEAAPVTANASPRQHADALVSMGVSYWEVGQRERAFEMTEAGLQRIDRAVAEGLLSADSLSVAQGNYSAMARALGKTPKASAGQGTQMARRGTTNNRQQGTRAQSRMAGRNSTSEAPRRR
jgi:tetratricopeptide (TPR) repeat protein